MKLSAKLRQFHNDGVHFPKKEVETWASDAQDLELTAAANLKSALDSAQEIEVYLRALLAACEEIAGEGLCGNAKAEEYAETLIAEAREAKP